MENILSSIELLISAIFLPSHNNGYFCKKKSLKIIVSLGCYCDIFFPTHILFFIEFYFTATPITIINKSIINIVLSLKSIKLIICLRLN